jgi:Leucine-rich repeat (LRR) protein
MKRIYKIIYLNTILALTLITAMDHSVYAMNETSLAPLTKVEKEFLKEFNGLTRVLEAENRNFFNSHFELKDQAYRQDIYIQRQELRLDYCEIRTVPSVIGNLANTVDLDLSNNQISTLPDAIGKLVNLVSCSLFCNQLMILPEAIGKLTNLVELDLSYNKLISLPDTIGSLGHLERLYLSDNNLTTLPDTMGKLRNLKQLSLSNNCLKTLPDNLNFSSLVCLFFDGNPQLSLEPLKLYDLLKGTNQDIKIYLHNTGLESFLSSMNIPMIKSGSGDFAKTILQQAGIQHYIKL